MKQYTDHYGVSCAVTRLTGSEAAEETMLLIVNASSEEEDFGWSSIVAIAEP